MKAYKKVSLLILILALALISLGASGCPWLDDDEDTIAGSSAPLPSAVSNLTAIAISSSQINLSWEDNSNNEESVKIERKTGVGGTYTEIATVGANVTSYSDTGFTPSTTYYYRIRAYNANGYSMYSNDASVTTLSAFLNVVAVAAGHSHSLALKTDGTLWAWGSNLSGQLGLGDNIYRNIPTQIVTDTNWAQVSASWNHSIALKTDGTLWAWGYNVDGQLGLGDYSPRNTPIQIGTDIDWKMVSTGGSSGSNHTLAISTTGGASTLWAWGRNNKGQLGLGHTNSPISTTTQVGTDTDWAEVTCGSQYSIARKTDGSLWAWGYNLSGQLGLGSTGDKNTPTKIGTDTDWVEIACGSSHTMAISTTGSASTVWAWGYNYFGQLGLGDSGNGTSRNIPTKVGTDTNWAMVWAGRHTTIARKTDGTLWAWGDNDWGQLGIGDKTDRNIPTKIGNDENWIQVACGNYGHILALKTNSTLWTWGFCGQLDTPVQVFGQ